jgi:hypothetical protein
VVFRDDRGRPGHQVVNGGPADCLIRDRDNRFTEACADRTDLVLSVIARRVSSQPLTGAEYRAAEY